MMKLLYLVSLLFLGCSSLKTEILESELEARAKGYILEFEFEQQITSPKRGLDHVTPLSIKGTIEFNDDKYFFKSNNYKSLQFDVVYTSTILTDEIFNSPPILLRDVYQPRVKILTDYHLTEDDLDFVFFYNSDPVKLDYSRDLVGQIYNEDGDRIASDDAEAAFVLSSKKGSNSKIEVENVGAYLLRIRLPKRMPLPSRELPNFNDTVFDFYRETVKRSSNFPEEDEEFLAMQISQSFFALKSLRRVDTAYSPYGNQKSKFMFDIKYDTEINFAGLPNIQNTLIQDLENLPTQTEESQILLSSLKATKQVGGIGGIGPIPVEAIKVFQLKGRIGFSKLNVIPTEGGQTLDLQYLDYFRFDVVVNTEGAYEELILYSMGLSSIELSLIFGEGLVLTKEWIGQKSFQLSEDAEFVFFPTRPADLIFVPITSSSQIIAYSIIDEIMESPLRNKKIELEMGTNEFIISMIVLRMVKFELSSIKPYQSCVPKKINTKLTKFGEYQDCLFPQNKKMECYAYKSLFPSGTEPTSCVVEECSSVDSVAFNRKCSKVSGAKNICKIDSVKKQVCVKREACTGSKKGDNCARVYQFLGENKKDTCVVESLPLASIVAPFNDASMQFKSNKYCH